MNTRLKNSLLITLLIASVLFGGFIIGPFSIRIYISILIFGVVLFMYRSLKYTTEIYLYLAFILFFLLALLINGEILTFDFFKYFFGRYFICIVSFFVFLTLIDKKSQIDLILKYLLLIGIFNFIISTFQFFGFEFAWAVPGLFNKGIDENEKFMLLSDRSSGLGVGVSGLFSNIVSNGYMSATFFFGALYYHSLFKSLLFKVISTILIFCMLFTVFETQQRLMFIVCCLAFVHYLIPFKKMRLFGFMLFLLVSLYVYISPNVILTSDDVGRVGNFNDADRLVIYSLGFDFVINNIFWGGIEKFAENLRINGYLINSSHNFFLNAFIYGGLLGGITISYLFFRMLFKSFYFIKIATFDADKSLSYFISLMIIAFLLNSLTHNSSLVTGEEKIWIYFALLIKSIYIIRFNKKQDNESVIVN
jgi:hypothetical protein